MLHGDETLRFAYTVQAGNGQACNLATTTADCDTDGITLAAGTVNSVANTLVELSGTPAAAVVSADTGMAAKLTYTGGLFKSVAARLKVDGSVTASASTAGPRATGAEIPATSQGKTLTVTFDKALGPFDQFTLQTALNVRASNTHTRKTQNQHPTHVARSGSTLTLTLGVPVRAGDAVELDYIPVSWTQDGSNAWVLKDTGSPAKLTPAIRRLAVTNNLAGAPPVPIRADIAGKSLRVVFDQALNVGAAPSGSAFRVNTSDNKGRNDIRRSPGDKRPGLRGTGTASVTGAAVLVTLEEAVGPHELADVDYAKPTSNPLKATGATGAEVNAFEQFQVRRVHDVTAPKLLDSAINTSDDGDPGESKIFLYFDEPITTSSQVNAGSFTVVRVQTDGTDAISVVSIARRTGGNGLTLTTNKKVRHNRDYTVSYTPGISPFKDQAGNALAGPWTVRAYHASTPALRHPSGGTAVTVNGDVVRIYLLHPLSVQHVPPPSAFTLWETNRYDDDGDNVLDARQKLTGRSIVGVSLEVATVILHLNHPIYPCNGTHPFRVSYTRPSANTDRLQSATGGQVNSWTADAPSDRARATNQHPDPCIR